MTPDQYERMNADDDEDGLHFAMKRPDYRVVESLASDALG
jgi:hypothetical protein